ncbi:MAG TPA: tryptophan 7-halogenase [Thermoanaerobaculia bacterium]
MDVLIVGAGPAGATAALNLAPVRSVAVIERRAEPPARIGESVPPAIRRLLADMGLFDDFVAQGHEPCYANRAVWGDPTPRDFDFLRDPDGHGWHLDRTRFERWLRDVARDRGADIVVESFDCIERVHDRWRAGSVSARLVIDAGGRAAPFARRTGAQVVNDDRLVAVWTSGRQREPSQRLTYVEAARDGWWYTAPLPNGRRVVAFHTDSDLGVPRSLEAFPRELACVLRGFVADQPVAVTAANSATLTPCVGDGWLAAGDAALSFDPLSSQGILNALFTGLAAAEASDRFLDGEPLDDYANTIAGVRDAYRAHLSTWYGLEQRWPDAPFWLRRSRSTPSP